MKKVFASLSYVILIALTFAVRLQASDTPDCPDADVLYFDMSGGVEVAVCKVGDIQVLAHNDAAYAVSVDVTVGLTTKSGQQSRSFHATLQPGKDGQIGLIHSPQESITGVKVGMDVVACGKSTKCGAKYGPVY